MSSLFIAAHRGMVGSALVRAAYGSLSNHKPPLRYEAFGTRKATTVKSIMDKDKTPSAARNLKSASNKCALQWCG